MTPYCAYAVYYIYYILCMHLHMKKLGVNFIYQIISYIRGYPFREEIPGLRTQAFGKCSER